MSTRFPRARLTAAVVVAFCCGLLFASGFDLTRFGWAQASSKTPAKPSAQQVQPLVETSNAFEAIAEHVTPSVVSIQSEKLARTRPTQRPRNNRSPGLDDFLRQFEMQPRDVPQEASGSGFIVSKDGYILTNNHVVADFDRVTVHLLDNRVFPAKVVGRDPTTDVAVLKIDANDLPTAQMGDDQQARVGQWVVAIGNPLGLDFTVTAGIVSARGRTLPALMNTRYAIQDYLQTDAAINPGNSGGPLVNIRGEVIGINSAIASSTGYYAGYGFAIPITLAKQVMDDIIQYGHVRRAVLGINIDEVEPNDAKVAGLSEIKGVKVSGFDPPDNPDASPAKKAGLEVGDIIVAAGGQPVDRVSSLQRVIRGFKPGDVVPIDAMRFGEKKTFRVKLGEPPAEKADDVAANDSDASPASNGNERSYDKLGITVTPVPADAAADQKIPSAYRSGLMVTDVSSNGPAYRELFQNRSIVVGVQYPEKRVVRSPADLEAVVTKLKSGDLIQLLVYDTARGGTTPVTLRIGAR
jgi:serine protease Do